jgi:transketolase
MTIEELERMAGTIRRHIIKMVTKAQSGHPGGSLSATDLITALYFRVMRLDPKNPDWPDRDRFILSKGHACPAWYAALAKRGYFDEAHLSTLRRLNSILQAHPDMKTTPGLDMTVGSLGQGLSAGLGMALSGKLRQSNYHVWVIIGDGEIQEGAIWEAAMAGAKWKLGNLTAILDRNRLQNDDFVDATMPVEPVADKWRAFNWHVMEIDGHNMEEIVAALEKSKTITSQPTITIAHTIKGKGISFMENVAAWHGQAPSEEQAALALEELEQGARG